MTGVARKGKPGPASGDALKRRLLLAAERVVAQRGFSGATLLEIHKAAQTRNASAVHYHYGSLEALLVAVFEHRSVPVNERRVALLAASGELGVYELVSALVRPLAQELIPRPEGNCYLRFLERAIIENRVAQPLVPPDFMRGWTEAERRLRDALSALPPQIAEIRMTLARAHFISGLAQIEAWMEEAPDRASLIPLMTEAVIDATVATIVAPMSQALTGALAESDAGPDLGLYPIAR